MKSKVFATFVLTLCAIAPLTMPPELCAQTAASKKKATLTVQDQTIFEKMMRNFYIAVDPLSEKELLTLMLGKDDLPDLFTPEYRQKLRLEASAAKAAGKGFRIAGYKPNSQEGWELHDEIVAQGADSLTIKFTCQLKGVPGDTDYHVVFRKVGGFWRINDMRKLGNG